MRQPHLYGATYGIVTNEKNEVLNLIRQNTWYYDGWYTLPAGHIEQWELAFASLQHEMEEEIWIKVMPKDVKLFHVLHRLNEQETWSREYFDLCYVIQNRSWDIINGEPDKSSWLARITQEQAADIEKPEDRLFIQSYFDQWTDKIIFTELDLR